MGERTETLAMFWLLTWGFPRCFQNGTQRKAKDVGVFQEMETEALEAPVSRLSESISLEIWFVSAADPSMNVLCVCFQYFVPSWDLCILGKQGKVKGTFGNYLANLKTISCQVGYVKRVHPRA